MMLPIVLATTVVAIPVNNTSLPQTACASLFNVGYIGMVAVVLDVLNQAASAFQEQGERLSNTNADELPNPCSDDETVPSHRPAEIRE